ncbi:hypothetical protein D039_1381B, partial [Vibrio parahaemolyticus EKP-028]
TVSTNAGQES